MSATVQNNTRLSAVSTNDAIDVTTVGRRSSFKQLQREESAVKKKRQIIMNSAEKAPHNDDDGDDNNHNDVDDEKTSSSTSEGDDVTPPKTITTPTTPAGMMMKTMQNNLCRHASFNSTNQRRRPNTGTPSTTGGAPSAVTMSRCSSTESLLDDISSRAVALFQSLDSQGSGFLGLEELALCCPDISQEELNNLFKQLDRDNDGRISVRDFKEGFRAISRTLWAKGNERRKSRSRILSTDGFSSYGGSCDQLANISRRSFDDTTTGSTNILNDQNVPEDMRGYLSSLSDGLSALQCQEQVCELYHMLTTECPHLVECYEAIVLAMIDQNQLQQQDMTRLEELYHRQKEDHESQLEHLDGVIEEQIQKEEEKIREQLKEKLNAAHRHEIVMKQQEVLSLQTKIRRLEMQIEQIKTRQDTEDDKIQLEMLRTELQAVCNENSQLKNELAEMESHVAITRSDWVSLRQDYEERCRELQREKILLLDYMKEQEHLMQQICSLRETNRQLNDTNDDLRSMLERVSVHHLKHSTTNLSPESRRELCCLEGEWLFSDVAKSLSASVATIAMEDPSEMTTHSVMTNYQQAKCMAMAELECPPQHTNGGSNSECIPTAHSASLRSVNYPLNMETQAQLMHTYHSTAPMSLSEEQAALQQTVSGPSMMMAPSRMHHTIQENARHTMNEQSAQHQTVSGHLMRMAPHMHNTIQENSLMMEEHAAQLQNVSGSSMMMAPRMYNTIQENPHMMEGQAVQHQTISGPSMMMANRMYNTIQENPHMMEEQAAQIQNVSGPSMMMAPRMYNTLQENAHMMEEQAVQHQNVSGSLMMMAARMHNTIQENSNRSAEEQMAQHHNVSGSSMMLAPRLYNTIQENSQLMEEQTAQLQNVSGPLMMMAPPRMHNTIQENSPLLMEEQAGQHQTVTGPLMMMAPRMHNTIQESSHFLEPGSTSSSRDELRFASSLSKANTWNHTLPPTASASSYMNSLDESSAKDLMEKGHELHRASPRMIATRGGHMICQSNENEVIVMNCSPHNLGMSVLDGGPSTLQVNDLPQSRHLLGAGHRPQTEELLDTQQLLTVSDVGFGGQSRAKQRICEGGNYNGTMSEGALPMQYAMAAMCTEDMSTDTGDNDSQQDDSGMSTLRDITELDSDYSVSVHQESPRQRHLALKQGSSYVELARGNSVHSSVQSIDTATMSTIKNQPLRNSLITRGHPILEGHTALPGAVGSMDTLSRSSSTLDGTDDRTAPDESVFSQDLSRSLGVRRSSRLLAGKGVTTGKRSKLVAGSSRLKANPGPTISMPKKQRQFKVVLAGDAAVGKSSFIIRVCDNRFASNTTATLGVDFRNKTIELDEEVISIQLWDTAGQERFRSMAKSHFRRGDGVLLFYDCTFERSFINVRNWIEDIKENGRPDIPLVIIANKIDLREEEKEKGQRVVSYEEGRRLAQQYDAIFMESSNKDETSTQEVMMELAKLLCAQEDIDISISSQPIDLKPEEDSKKAASSGKCCKL